MSTEQDLEKRILDVFESTAAYAFAKWRILARDTVATYARFYEEAAEVEP